MKEPKKQYPSWTSPKHLDPADHESLKKIYDLYKEGKMEEAMEYASFSCDTEIREEIPGDVWLKMGGNLTPRGWEKLNAKKKQNGIEK